MSLSRRDFVKLCTSTVAGFGVSQMFHPAVQEVLAQTLTGERPPVFWIQGQACTGCSVTLLNNAHPGIADVLLKIISLEFHPTVMGNAGGEPAYAYMMDMAQKNKGAYFLVVEGAIPTKYDGRLCVIAEEGHNEITMTAATQELAAGAAAVLAVGTCAAYGGVPAARGSVTGAVGVTTFLRSKGIETPVINIPGCPPHPDWIVGTAVLGIQALSVGMLGEFAKMSLDASGRPWVFYPNVHLNCPYLQDFMIGNMSKTMTDKNGCRYTMGCKGPLGGCDSPKRLWNNRSNWCVNSATCIGCTTPKFPDGSSPFYSN